MSPSTGAWRGQGAVADHGSCPADAHDRRSTSPEEASTARGGSCCSRPVVVATGRDPEKGTAAIGAAEDLLAVKLDSTNPADAAAAVNASVERLGRIDVPINNAGNLYAGFFEELSPAEVRTQMETNQFGPMNFTRAVLPVRVERVRRGCPVDPSEHGCRTKAHR